MPSAATAELIEASSYLERLPGNAKRELGNWLLERTWSDRNAKLWSGVARLGSRIPMYSSLHYVLGPPVAEAWLDELMREKLNEVGGASDAAVSLARYTGDRSRDISDAKRQQVLQALTRISAPELALRKVREWVPVEEQERRSWLGDDLPLGLRLVLDVAPAAP